jgi:hypothetical protein
MDLISNYSWDVSEEEYRNSDALHYSLISQYKNRGFDALIHPEILKTEALLIGSMVDLWITGSRDEFEDKYKCLDFDIDKDTKTIVDAVIEQTNGDYDHLQAVPIPIVSDIAKSKGFWPADKWSDDKRVEALYKKTNINKYYSIVIESMSNGIQYVSKDMYQCAINCGNSLFENLYVYQRLYGIGSSYRWTQIKFKTFIEGVEFAAMFDVLQQDPVNKILYPIDLKTSSKPEYHFGKSFIEFNYDIQARLYSLILQEVIKDTPFKDYTIAPFEFVVVGKNTYTPLCWSFEDNLKRGDLEYGGFTLKDPIILGQEIKWYMNNMPQYPKGITDRDTNSLTNYLKNYDNNKL